MNSSKSISSILLPMLGVFIVAVVIYGYSRAQATSLAVTTPDEQAIVVTPEQIAVATSTSVVIPTSSALPTPSPTPVPVPTPTPIPSTTYRNGTYTTSTRYATPKVPETIQVSLTLTNDIVTSATVTEKAISQDSRHYQRSFEASYKAYVIGKNIDSLNLSRVSGASLTTDGFNSALAIIKSQARI